MTTLTAALTKSDPLGKFPLLFLQTGLFFAAVNFPSLHRVNVPPCWNRLERRGGAQPKT